MARWPEFRRLFRLPTTRAETVRGEIDVEVDFHLAMRVEELMALGMPEAEARAEAARRFGDVPEARAALVRTDRSAALTTARATWLADLARDIRFAGRDLWRKRGFAFVAIGVLGLGIGLTTSMVSLFDRLALRPLPYPNADRLGLLWLVTNQGEHSMRVSPNREVIATLADLPGVERVDRLRPEQMIADFSAGPELVAARIVTPGLLSGLGARVVLGRSLTAEDTIPGAPLAVVLAHRTWRQHFAGRADVLGKAIRLDDRIGTVVGVLGAGFDLTSLVGGARAALWLPMRADSADLGGGGSVLLTFEPGVAVAAIADQIDARIKAAAPVGDQLTKNFRAAILGASDLASASFRRTLSLLLGAVGLVLLVACANVAALLLGQAVGRFQEFGVRSALGAGRARMIRQLITEAGLLGTLGGLAGIVTTTGVLAIARAVRPESLLTIDEVRVNLATLGLAGLVAAIAVVLFGLAPIWAVSREDLVVTVVGRSRRSIDGHGARRLRSTLVVGQIALSLMLLVGAGLLLKSFVRERTLPLGFEARGLGHLQLSFPDRDFPSPSGRALVAANVLDRVRRTAGVTAATLSGNAPFDFGVSFGEFVVEGRPLPAVEAKAIMPVRFVGPDFFAVTGLPLVAGRTFGPDTTQREVVIDAATAHRVFGTLAVIGKRIRLARDHGEWETIIGVATDLRGIHDGFEGVPSLYYREEAGDGGRTLLLRMTDDAELDAVTRVVREIDPAIRIRSASTALRVLDDQLANTRFTLTIVGFFAILALVVAMVGLYGVIAFAVRQRHFEFGVRLALGALPTAVTAMVLREGIARIGLGMAIGLAGSVAMVRLIRGLLYQMSPFDPVVFLAAGGLLAAVAVAAVWIPARQASRVDPLEAIRAE